MILVDKRIREYIEQNQLIIEGFDETNLGGVSYDLTIDKIVGLGDEKQNNSINLYDLKPGEAIFVKSKEMLSIPKDILARVAQKNSRVRMGLYVDNIHYHPGHKTYAFLRVQNLSSNIIQIKQGDKIAQLFFEQLIEVPEQTYEAAEAFSNEMEFKGLSIYQEEYEKSIKKAEKVKEDIENKEGQICANTLTLMGIIAAVFSIITINFQAFTQAIVNLKFVLTLNLSLAFTFAILFGLIYLIISKQKKIPFCIMYGIVLALIAVSTILVHILL